MKLTFESGAASWFLVAVSVPIAVAAGWWVSVVRPVDGARWAQQADALFLVTGTAANLLILLMFFRKMEVSAIRHRAERAATRGEQRYRSLVEASSAIVWNTPASGEFETEQAAWSAFTGQSFEQLRGWGWLDAIHPDDRALTELQWSDAVARQSNYEVEHRVLRHDGEYRHMHVRAIPILADDQTIDEWVGVHTDIDVTKRAQLAMREAKEAAEAASRMKGEFLANVSHEIRTPMNAILGMTELTLQSELGDEQRENLQTIRSATESLLSVINDLLDFSKIEAGKLELDPVDFQLREQVRGLMSLFGPPAHAKGLELICQVRPDVPDRLLGDPARLRQVAANLVGNAIKFTERGEVVVEVGVDLESQPADGIALHFQVSDTGIGVPEAKRDLIFAPFAQADGSTTRLYGGTGLGLAISAQLLALMGGRIWVESEVGRGSTFHFIAHFGVAVTGEPEAPSLLEEDLRGLRVLVVDDNAVNRRILDETLSYWGMIPTLADRGQSALDQLEHADRAGEPFSLIVVDAMMPQMDGFTLCERISADPRRAGSLLLMLTSIDRQRFAERCRKVGVAACLNKPIHQLELKAAILAALGKMPRSLVREATAPAAAHRPAARALRILMAEDNAFNQRVVRLMLGRAGHSVTIANNGREAVAAMEREPFDLVLMDLQMPEMDGFQATAAIRAAEAGGRRRAPIIALTAHAMKEDRLRCLEAGMDGYLSKPIREEMLRRAVEDCMPLIDANAVAAVSDEPPVCPWDDAMDVEAALAQVDGDRGFLAEMARMYLDESPVLLARIQAAVAAGDPAALVAPAHSLKNWFGNFAARLAYDTVRDLENLGRAGDLATAATTLAKLQGEIGRLALAMATLEPWTVPTDLDNEPLAITIGSGSPPCTR